MRTYGTLRWLPKFSKGGLSGRAQPASSRQRIATRLLITCNVRVIPFVFGAEVFRDVVVRLKKFGELDGECFGVHLGVVDGYLDIHVAEVAPVEPFRQVQALAVRMAHTIQPAPIVESDGVHDKRVALPSADRISQPQRLRIGGSFAAVGRDLAKG